MEDWRGLFRERFVVEENTEEQYLRKYDHRTIVEELEHFIEEELSKAREEGRKEGGQAFLRDTLSYCSFHNGKPRRLGGVEIVARELSKLKSKE